MSKVMVYLAVGGAVEVDIDAEDPLAEMATRLSQGFVTLETPNRTILANRDHIVRIDLQTGA